MSTDIGVLQHWLVHNEKLKRGIQCQLHVIAYSVSIIFAQRSEKENGRVPSFYNPFCYPLTERINASVHAYKHGLTTDAALLFSVSPFLRCKVEWRSLCVRGLFSYGMWIFWFFPAPYSIFDSTRSASTQAEPTRMSQKLVMVCGNPLSVRKGRGLLRKGREYARWSAFVKRHDHVHESGLEIIRSRNLWVRPFYSPKTIKRSFLSSKTHSFPASMINNLLLLQQVVINFWEVY